MIQIKFSRLNHRRENAKSKIHGLAELSASNKYEKQMTSTKQAHSVSH